MNDQSASLAATLDVVSGDLRLRFEPGPDGRQRFETALLDRAGVPHPASLPNVHVGGGLDLWLRGERRAAVRVLVYNPTLMRRTFNLIERGGMRHARDLAARSWVSVDFP